MEISSASNFEDGSSGDRWSIFQIQISEQVPAPSIAMQELWCGINLLTLY
jgi:hypothetical protein